MLCYYCTAKWFSYTYICIYTYEYCSLPYTVRPCCLSILYVKVYICNPKFPLCPSSKPLLYPSSNPSLLATINLFFVSVILFLFHRKVHLYHTSVQFIHSVMSISLWPHGLQHARLSCPSPTPTACSNLCPSSQWCHPTISSSVVPFYSHLQFPSFRVFSNESVLCIRWPKYWSFSFNISPSNDYSGLISLELTDLITLQSRLSRVFSNTTVQKYQFFGAQLSL